MFVAICLSLAMIGAEPKPASIPDRWLLKLVPENLPQLPDRVFTTTWYDNYFPRGSGAWEEWITFQKKESKAVVVRIEEDGTTFQRDKPAFRTLPMAIHGPIIEFDRKLFTATLHTAKDPKDDTLYLGSAIELKGNIWYQVGTTSKLDKPVVEEWRLDFENDPRKNDEGKVLVRHHLRVISEKEGKSLEIKATFKSTPATERTRARLVAFTPIETTEKKVTLAYLQIQEKYIDHSSIWVYDQDCKAMKPAQRNAPTSESVELVQLPK